MRFFDISASRSISAAEAAGTVAAASAAEISEEQGPVFGLGLVLFALC